MNKNNSKAMLAALMAGKVTKETEALRLRTTHDKISSSLINEVLSEAPLPSASDLTFNVKRVGDQTIVTDASDPNAAYVGNNRGFAPVDKNAILGLLKGKKPREIIAETKEAQQISPSTNATNDYRNILNEKINGKSNSGYVPKVSNVQLDDIQELVENIVYDILAEVVGSVNNKLKNKDEIKSKLEETVLFLKLTNAMGKK